MAMTRIIYLSLLRFFIPAGLIAGIALPPLNSQPVYRQIEKVYKTKDSIELSLHFYYPESGNMKKIPAAVIFFFGGGWQKGGPGQFEPHSIFLAENGLVGITAEYRIRSKHGTTPQDAISDARSAVRWLKAHAAELGIDSSGIVIAGGSAGGHLAACTATLPGFNDPEDDTSISPVPAAMVLFNPVLDATVFAERFGGMEKAKKASPLWYVNGSTPPTLIFHGTDDYVVPAESMLEFQELMREQGNYCEVILFGGKGHAFFNKGRDEDRPFKRTLVIMKQFLTEQGFMQ